MPCRSSFHCQVVPLSCQVFSTSLNKQADCPFSTFIPQCLSGLANRRQEQMPATKLQCGHTIDTIRPRQPPSSSLFCFWSLPLSIYISCFVAGLGFSFPLWLGASVSANWVEREHGLLRILIKVQLNGLDILAVSCPVRKAPTGQWGPISNKPSCSCWPQRYSQLRFTWCLDGLWCY